MPISIWGSGPASGSGSGGGSTSDASAANQVTQITAANTTNTNLGAQADAQADATVNGSLLARVRYIAATLLSVLNRLPTLVSGRIPVDGSGVTQPVSAASLPLPTGAATSALQTSTNTTLASIDSKVLTDTQLRATPINILPPVTVSWSTIGNTNSIITSVIAANSKLQSLLIQNLTGNVIHVQTHSVAPSTGAIPSQSYRVGANSSLLLGTDFYGDGGATVSPANPVFAISSTHGTYTAQASPNTSITVRYIP